MQRIRPSYEMVRVFWDNREDLNWLFWNIKAEQMFCHDEHNTDLMWQEYLHNLSKAVDMQDYAEIYRIIDQMAEYMEVSLPLVETN